MAIMSRRAEWREILDAEVKRWSAMPCDELISALTCPQAYEVEFDAKKYQVDVKVLEVTERYLHIAVAVGDGGLPAGQPLSHSFFCPMS
jgi:hypothetical protein